MHIKNIYTLYLLKQCKESQTLILYTSVSVGHNAFVVKWVVYSFKYYMKCIHEPVCQTQLFASTYVVETGFSAHVCITSSSDLDHSRALIFKYRRYLSVF